MVKSSIQSSKVPRARSAYNYFFKAVLNSVKEKFYGEHGRQPSYSEMAKMVSTKWKKVDKAEKAYYEKLAAHDKRRYALEVLRKREERKLCTYCYVATVAREIRSINPAFSRRICTPDKPTSQDDSPSKTYLD